MLTFLGNDLFDVQDAAAPRSIAARTAPSPHWSPGETDPKAPGATMSPQGFGDSPLGRLPWGEVGGETCPGFEASAAHEQTPLGSVGPHSRPVYLDRREMGDLVAEYFAQKALGLVQHEGCEAYHAALRKRPAQGSGHPAAELEGDVGGQMRDAPQLAILVDPAL